MQRGGHAPSVETGIGPEEAALKLALGLLAVGAATGVYGLSLLRQGGPCTLHLAFVGLGLMGVGGACGLGGVIKLVALLRAPND